MSSGPAGAMVAVCFVWLGMVLAISFLEAPLKFRAPEVTIRIGLGIGRLVFRALNTIEVVFAACLLVLTLVEPPAARVVVTFVVVAAGLGAQLLLVRPALTRSSDAVLAGGDPPRSHVHVYYVALEAIKVAALLLAGVFLLTS